MGIKFQPLLFSGFVSSSSGGGGGGYAGWKAPVTTEASLPTVGNTDGDVRVTTATDYLWVWDAATSRWINTGVKSSVVGSSPNASGYSLNYVNVGSNRTELQLSLQPANSTNPGIVTTGTQTLSGNKTLSNDLTVQGTTYANGGVDTTTNGATLSIGTVNAGIINLGNASAVINFNGTVNNNNVTNLNVADQLITINDGGGAGSGSGSGFEIEEAGVATGYIKTSGDRNSFSLKAPNTAGIATITPGVAGITLNQSSHNPVTVTDTNSIDLTLASQALSADVRFANSTIDSNTSGIKVATGGISNNEVNNTAAIARTKLASGTTYRILANDVTGVMSENAAITANRAVISDSNGQLLHSTTTATEIGYVSGVTSAIQSQINAISSALGPVVAGTFTGLANNTANQAITGFTLSTAAVGSFEALVRVRIDATSDLFSTFKLIGTQKAASAWDVTSSFGGDSIPGVSFDALDTAGTTQVRISVGNMTGFVSGAVIFRAMTLGV